MLNKVKQLNNKFLIVLMVVFSILRIYIGSNIPLWLFNLPHDDLLFLDYSNIFTHFHQWNIFSLAKNIPYSIFLYLVNVSGLPYRLCLSLLFVFAALIVAYGVYNFISKNKALIFVAFLFILFLPYGFDSWLALRVYRNGIMAPVIIIAFSSLFIFINTIISKNENKALQLFWAIFSGLAFTFNFYIKEDGIVLLPIFLMSIVACLVYSIFKNKNNIIKNIIICLIPLIIFASCTIAYEEVNNHYFGVSEINTRTEGELGEFWSILLKVDDSNKTTDVWVPPSTIEKVWNASPTLQKHPELLDNWMNTSWANGDLKKNNLDGDIIIWSLRDALNDSDLYSDEKSTSDFFAKVNDELNQGFENGSLNESDKIFIASSATGRDVDEVKEIIPFFKEGLKICMLYNHFHIGGHSSDNLSPQEINKAESILNDHVTMSNESLDANQQLVVDLGNFSIEIYRIIAPLISVLAILSFIGLCIHQIKYRFRDRYKNALLGFEFMMIGTFLVYIFAVAWFSTWMDGEIFNVMKSYTPTAQGIFALFEILSVCSLFAILSKKFRKNT